MFERKIFDYSEWNYDLDVLDDVVFLADPPEFILPEWNRPDEPYPWETHDYTMDYDYPEHWIYTDDYDDVEDDR